MYANVLCSSKFRWFMTMYLMVRRRIRGRWKQQIIRTAKCSGHTTSMSNTGSVVFGVHAGVWGKGDEKNRGNHTCVGLYSKRSGHNSHPSSKFQMTWKWMAERREGYTLVLRHLTELSQRDRGATWCVLSLCVLWSTKGERRDLMANDNL